MIIMKGQWLWIWKETLTPYFKVLFLDYSRFTNKKKITVRNKTLPGFESAPNTYQATALQLHNPPEQQISADWISFKYNTSTTANQHTACCNNTSSHLADVSTV